MILKPLTNSTIGGNFGDLRLTTPYNLVLVPLGERFIVSKGDGPDARVALWA